MCSSDLMLSSSSWSRACTCRKIAMTDLTEAREHIKSLLELTQASDWTEMTEAAQDFLSRLDVEGQTVEGDDVYHLRRALEEIHKYAVECAGEPLEHTFIRRCAYTALHATSPTTFCEQAKVIRLAARSQPVEITDEMVEAGVAAWGRYDQGYDTRADLARRILTAVLNPPAEAER